MPVRRLPLPVLACALIAAALLPATAAAARATPKPPTLVARATFPGVGPREWRSAFGAAIKEESLKVVARPDAATLTVEDPSVRYVRRRGHVVRVPSRACGRATVHISLVPGDGDLLAFSRTLLPEAQHESYISTTVHNPFVAWLTAGHPSSRLALRSWADVPEHEQHPTKRVYRHAKITLVSDWTDAGVHGWAVVEQTVERLRTTGSCRYDPTAEPTPALGGTTMVEMPSSSAMRSPAFRARSTHSSIVTFLMGTNGRTSSAPMRGCSPE